MTKKLSIQKFNSPHLKDLLIVRLSQLIFKEGPLINATLPVKIGQYRFLKRLGNDYGHRSYRLALYENSQGKKAFAKIWSGRRKTIDYLFLVNERNSYFLLNKYARIKDPVKIPGFIQWDEQKNYAALLIDHVPGQTMEKSSAKKQLKAFMTVTDWLNKKTQEISDQERIQDTLSFRSHREIIISTLALIFLTTPKLIFSHRLTRTIKSYLSTVPVFTQRFPNQLVHKSLEPKNILSGKKGLFLIDFQFFSLSQKMVELSQTLFFCWENKAFKKLLVSDSTMNGYIKTTSDRNLFKLYCLYTSLLQTYENVAQTDHIKKFFDYTLSL